jgi:hypothetical protein
MTCPPTTSQQGSGAKAKFALYRETLRTTGPVSPGVLQSFRKICDDPFFATSFQRTILGRPSMRFPGMAESIGPIWSNQNQILGRAPISSRRSAPSPGKRTRREDHALLIVRDEFRTGYSLIGLLASRARLRFTGTARIKLWTAQRKQIIIER